MEKWKFQRIILIISILLLLGKFIAYYITNSAGVYSDAMESIVNVIAGTISLLSLRWASQPADKNHPFGHGKVEFISASFEAILIIIAGGIIIYEGVNRLFNPAKIESIDVGIIIIGITGVINYILGYWSIKKGKQTNSMALIAGGKHLQSDTYSTIGLVLGLVLVSLTDWIILDSILAIVFGMIIIITGINIIRKTFGNLVDENDKEKINQISKIIKSNLQDDWINIHNLKAIKYGSITNIYLDITLPFYYTIEKGHKCAEELQDIIRNNISEINIFVHNDSCDREYCDLCRVKDCKHRNHEFIKSFAFNIDEMIVLKNK